MAKIPMGVQLYSVRKDAERDLAGTLKAIAGMGYEGVEFAGYYGHAASEVRKLLDAAGLKCCGTHLAVTALLGDELEKTIEFNRTIGNKYLVCPWVPPEYREGREGWHKVAKVLTEAAGRVRKHGMMVGYHNHNIEFKPEAGEVPWDVLLSETPDDVIMQLDTGNAMHGGADPAALLEKCANRATTVHLKEFSGGHAKALIGEGDTDWEKVFELCEHAGRTEWYIVEQESYAYQPLECIAKCLDNLRRMGK